MKKITLIIGSTIVGGIISAVSFAWFARAEPPAERTSTTERKISFWYDPMYPNTRFDKPGKSPFMNTDLVPRYADEESSASGVRVGPAQTQNLGVEAAIVTCEPPTFAQSFPTDASYNEYQYVIVQTRTAGFIDKMYSLTVGDKVQKDTPLLDLIIPNWMEAQSGYLLLRETGGMTTQTEGVLEWSRLAGMPEADIRRLITIQRVQTCFTFKALIDGAITTLDLRVGMNIARDNAVVKIQGTDLAWVIAAILESIAWLVKDVSQLTLTVPTRPDKTPTIRKWTLLPGVDTAIRMLQLRPEVDSTDETLKSGMDAWLQLNTTSEPMLFIPSQALTDIGNEQWVITVGADGRLVPRCIAVSQVSQGVTVLHSGLAESEKTISSGLLPVNSEANTSDVLERVHSESATHACRGNDQ